MPTATPTIAEVATTEPAPSPTETPKLLRSFTVVSTGDILLHERTWNQARMDGKDGNWDFYPQLADIKPLTSTADLGMCHLETPLAKSGGPYSGYPVFNSPPQILQAVVKLGFDFCDQVSNHSLDQGSAGVKRTLDYLDEVGIAHTGSYRTKQESQTPTIMTVAGTNGEVQVCLIAAAYGFNGFTPPEDKPWLINELGAKKLLSDARACKSAGAEVVIAHVQWGVEYSTTASESQRKLAKKLANSGLIALVVGDHTHCVQPIEKIDNMWVAYSHGNLVAAQREPETIKSEGLLTRWTITENSDGSFAVSKAEFAPLLITDDFPVRVLDVNKSLTTGKWISTTKKRLEKAQQRTTKTVLSLGADVVPITQ